MKTRPRLIPAAAAIAMLGFAGAAFAQTPAYQTSPSSTATPATTATTPATSRMTLTAFSTVDEPFALSKLAGQPLRGAGGEEFGSVSDFLLEPASGKVRFAIVPTGRGASGETFRLVPMAAFQPATAPNGFTLGINRSQWNQVGTMIEQQLGARVTLNAEQLQRNARQFALTGQDDASGANDLVRASSLKGQSLVSGNEQIAVIDDVLIDASRQAAAAVVIPSGVAAAANQKFVVPFPQLQVSANAQGAITTALTRADFQQTNAALAPTGYSSADTAVTAVQQALANNRNIAPAGVQVVSEPRLVLRGSVTSEQQKTEIQRTAQQAAPGVAIDNQITVRRW